MVESFAEKWFVIYYPVFGVLLLISGSWLAVFPSRFTRYLRRKAEHENPPALIRNVLKYWFLFTIPCLILSFFPISFTELLFSIWSLLMVYIAGSQLLRWPQFRVLIQDHPLNIPTFVRWLGVGMMSAAIVILMLGYVKVLAINN